VTAIARRDVGTDLHDTADALVELGSLALAFGGIARNSCFHADQLTPESDTDHTVMLGWTACAFAARYYPHLDRGLVAQFALIHDMPEVYAGDTPTLRISDQERLRKQVREHAAAEALNDQFRGTLPWVGNLLGEYERQEMPEARYVRGLDKVMTSVVVLVGGAWGVLAQGIDPVEFAQLRLKQNDDMRRYVPEFDTLLDLHLLLGERVQQHYEELWRRHERPEQAMAGDAAIGEDTPIRHIPANEHGEYLSL
jgi:5'-deoxynucleotidase YfbR-like HD superfamily hydrolase